MLKLILPFLLLEICICQVYIPRLNRNPNLRPSVIRFRRPSVPKIQTMEAAPSDSSPRLSLPKPVPFIPGATAYVSRPGESVGNIPLSPRPQFNNYEFSTTEESKNPEVNVALDGGNLVPQEEEASLPDIELGNPVEQDFSPSGVYAETPNESEVNLTEDYSENAKELLPSENIENLRNENFHDEPSADYEYVNNEQENVDEEAPLQLEEQNINENQHAETVHKENNEATASSFANQDFAYDGNVGEPIEEYFEESVNEEESESPEHKFEPRIESGMSELEAEHRIETGTETEMFKAHNNDHVQQTQDFNFHESASRPEEKTSNIPVYNAYQQEIREELKDISKLPNTAETIYTANHRPVFNKAEAFQSREFPRRPTFNLRPNRFENKRPRYPALESENKDYSALQHHEPREESAPSLSKFSSYNENSLQKQNSFSNTPRIISQPKYQQETKKRRRPYKPYLEPTPQPYEEEKHLNDYPDYSDDNAKSEPDRLSVLLQQTKFNCLQKKDGYYADENLECEVFHFCQDKVRHSWLCPSGSSFHQVHLICMPQSDDNICEKSSNFHFVNDYLYKEAPESTGRNRTYVQRYYPKGYEGGIAFLEEQQSISKNPALHKTLSPYEKEQFRQANQRKPSRNYHPQHSVQAHERIPVNDYEVEDIPQYEEISQEGTPERDYRQNDIGPYEEDQQEYSYQTDEEIPQSDYDTQQSNFDKPQTNFETHQDNFDIPQTNFDDHQNDFIEQIKKFKQEPAIREGNKRYQINSFSTRQENVPFANTHTQGHIRRPQELYPRPQAISLSHHNSGSIRRVPHSFYRRQGSSYNH